MPPPLAFATSNEYVFQRDFVANKWVPITSDNTPCRVSFMKRDSNYFMRLFKPGDAPKDFPLARESKFHYSPDGFLQIPLANVKELYAIKFKQRVDGETFYAQIVNEMNLPWLSSKVSAMTMEPGQLPPPQVNSGPAPPASLPTHAPAASQGFVSQHPGQPLAPELPLRAQQYPPPTGPRVIPPSGTRNPVPPTNADQRFYNQQNQLGGQIPLNQLNNPNMGNPNMGNPNMGNPNMGNPNMGNPNMGTNHPDFHPGSQLSRTPPGPGFHHQQQHNPGVRNVPGFADPVRPPINLPPKPKPMPKHRDPEPVPEAQLGELAMHLMRAINQGDKSQAERLLNMALTTRASFRIECQEIHKPDPEPTFQLEVVIEFQQPQKKNLSVFLEDVRESDSIFGLQAKVEQQFFIPRSSQNWIIGPKLIKNDDKHPIKEHGLRFTKGGDMQKAYLYVMHTKKANVAKEELEAIQSRQRIQQNRQQGNTAPLPPVDSTGHMQQGGRPQQYAGNPGQQYGGNAGNPGQQYGGNVGNPGQQYPGGNAGNPGQQYRGNAGPQGNFQQPGMNQGYGQMAPNQGMVNEPTYDKIGNRGYAPGFNESGLPNFRVNQDPGVNPQLYQQQMAGNEQIYERLNHQPRGPGGPMAPPQHFASAGPPQSAGNVSRPPPGGVNVLPVRAKPPPEPEPVKEPQGWACGFCTFINKPARPGCEQCGNAPPEDYQVPDDAPLTSMQLDAKKNDELFKQFEQQEAAQLRAEALKNYQEMLNAEDAQLVSNKEEFDCLICYAPVEPGEGVVLRSCLHEFCKDCLKETILNAQTANVQCPFDDGNYMCGMDISEREMRAVLTEEELEAVYRRGLREAENASANSFHCKTVDCGGFCFYEDDVNEFVCPVCTKRNCLLCKAIHEGMDCKEYQDDLKRRAANDEAAKATQQMLEKLVTDGVAMKCPQCQIIVQKKDGCDWVRCSMCRTEICWATKGPRWGPKGHGDTSGGCRCRVNGKKCTPECRNCH